MFKRIIPMLSVLITLGVVAGQLGPLVVIKSADKEMIYAGEEVNFTIFINNTGDQTISQINITDDLLPGKIGPIELDPQMNYTYWFVTNIQDDLTNNVTVEGLNSTEHIIEVNASAFVDVIHPSLMLNKTVDREMIYSGENVTYTIYLENTGDVNITAINITDTEYGPVAGPVDLSPGENITQTYNLTIFDDLQNNATAFGLDPLTTNLTVNASAFVDVIHPSLMLNKTVDREMIYSGENVTYTIYLENTGDVNITNIWATDPAINILMFGGLELGPGQNCTEQINVTLYEDLLNVANVSGMDPINRLVEANSTAYVEVIHPNLTLTKTVEPTTVPAKGKVSYIFLVENIGDVNLTQINLTDPGLNWMTGPFNLTPGQNISFMINTTAFVTRTNNATAIGLDPLGNPVEAWDTAQVVIISTGDIRSLGYWKHQFGDKGRKHIDRDTLEIFLGLIVDQSTIFEERFNLSYYNASSYLWLKKASMLNRSVQQCLACWLNWANGAVEFSDLVDTDWDGEPDMMFSEAMGIVEDLIKNGEDKEDWERAKDICDSINNMGGNQHEEETESEGRGPPEDKGEPQGRGPPEDKTPPVKRGPPEDKGEPQGRGPPEKTESTENSEPEPPKQKGYEKDKKPKKNN